MKEQKSFEQRVNIKLFERIMEQIETEPQRFLMAMFFDGSGWDTGREDCQTAACIAGWAIALTDKEAIQSQGLYHSDHLAMTMARDLLGITTIEAQRLFLAPEWPEPFRSAFCRASNSKAENAAIAIQRIEHFLRSGGL